MDSVERRTEGSQRDSFAFVLNVAEITDAESCELVPGHVLRRATSDEIGEIIGRIRGLRAWIPLVASLWEGRYAKDGNFEQLPEQQWRYFVIAFRRSNQGMVKLQAALDITPIELEIGFTIISLEMLGQQGTGMVHDPRRLLQVLQDAPHDSFFKPVSTNDLSSIGGICSKLDLHDGSSIDLKRHAWEVGQLKALPYGSPLRFLGYFAILESLLTHSPTPGDSYDSITRQVKKKIALLNNRWPDRIDYTAFGAPGDKVWSKMYEYRSLIAHGNTPKIEGKLQLLGNHERALQLVKETVKSTIRYALEGPQLLVDLREC